MSKTTKKNTSRFTAYRLVLLTTLVLFSLFTIYLQTQPQAEPNEVSQPTFLYVQTAHSGSLSPELENGIRILKLNDVSPSTVYFSDRPERITGHQPTAEFIHEWSRGEDSFASNPPNAALDIIGESSQTISIIELMSATYDAQTKTLEYEVIILDNETGISIPESFGEVALFIDSTHKDYHCDCSSSSSRNCKCRFKYTLGKSKTKEFRGYCDDEVFSDVSMGFSGRKKGTSCTAGVYWNNYTSRSCTNWSPIASDEINITIHCKHFDEDIKKTDPVPHS